ncbi:hypothetical protein [Sphingobacterium sp. HMA12]|uniref:hypothetical protein n=1 Tax=Sphingobacterium sp. HMA12 TaxID=2050894 RepID=UPI000CE9E5EC|nr:hypothetical protein [Sphingobacterium sp. HMA12]
MIRLYLAIFAVILIGLTLSEIQNGESIVVIIILGTLALIVCSYLVYSIFHDVFFLKRVKRAFERLSFESLLQGNNQTYIVESLMFDCCPTSPVATAEFTVSGQKENETEGFLHIIDHLENKSYNLYIFNIQISKDVHIFNGKYKDQIKFNLYAPIAKAMAKKDLLSVKFDREYKSGKLRFSYTVEVPSKKIGESEYCIDSNWGYLKGLKF